MTAPNGNDKMMIMEQREIKFRCWNKREKIMMHFDWLSGIKDLHLRSIEEAVFQQYIGLKDKNGTEIYEDDLVKYPSGRLYRVNRVGAGFWFVGSGLPDIEPIPDEVKIVEVIGNIYSNPKK